MLAYLKERGALVPRTVDGLLDWDANKLIHDNPADVVQASRVVALLEGRDELSDADQELLDELGPDRYLERKDIEWAEAASARQRKHEEGERQRRVEAQQKELDFNAELRKELEGTGISLYYTPKGYRLYYKS